MCPHTSINNNKKRKRGLVFQRNDWFSDSGKKDKKLKLKPLSVQEMDQKWWNVTQNQATPEGPSATAEPLTAKATAVWAIKYNNVMWDYNPVRNEHQWATPMWILMGNKWEGTTVLGGKIPVICGDLLSRRRGVAPQAGCPYRVQHGAWGQESLHCGDVKHKCLSRAITWRARTSPWCDQMTVCRFVLLSKIRNPSLCMKKRQI